MSEIPTRPYGITEPAPSVDPITVSAHSPTLEDEFLHAACTLARGRASWTPGPGHDTEDLPWLKGARAA